MPFAWSSRDRLCPMRMVFDDIPNYPKYETVKYRRPRLRRTMLELQQSTRLENCRWVSRSPAGRLGEWPVFKYGRRKRSVSNGRREGEA